jgi:uncharacterized protein YpuA (DUF1002 family)
MITHGLAVAFNSLLALKNFHVFLNVFSLNEKPGMLERWIISSIKKWIERKAIWQFNDLKSQISESLKNYVFNLPTMSLFEAVVFFTAQSKDLLDAKEVFDNISQIELKINIQNNTNRTDRFIAYGANNAVREYL